jgi:hypothetical protein
MCRDYRIFSAAARFLLDSTETSIRANFNRRRPFT